MAIDLDFQKRIHEELQRSARMADKEDKEFTEQCAVLMKNPAFQSYMALLNRRIETLGLVVLEPANGMDNAVALEYIKGTMRGLIIARDLPAVTMQAMKASTSNPANGDDADD